MLARGFACRETQGIRASGINRKKMFITTKLKPDEDMLPGAQMKAFEKSLDLLQLDYIDLYLIHWPVAGKTLQAWEGMEEIYKSGRARLAEIRLDRWR